MSVITSLRNDRVKQIHTLQTQVKARRREGRLVLEGARLIQDALNCGLEPEFVFYLGAQETLNRLAFRMFRELMSRGVQCLPVSEAVMEHVSDLETHQGLVAVFPQPELPVPESPDLILVIDAMRDPGNLGSVLRTAAAAGVSLVVLGPGTVDPYNPKVLRGGMGAHFRVPVVQTDWGDIALQYGHLHTYMADAGGDLPYYAVDWLRPSMIIVGSEAHGVGTDARQIAGIGVRIPMASETESLNAAVAAGVILYEVQRQRILSARGDAKA
jgi:TrmH family RNA methyltransferase